MRFTDFVSTRYFTYLTTTITVTKNTIAPRPTLRPNTRSKATCLLCFLPPKLVSLVGFVDKFTAEEVLAV